MLPRNSQDHVNARDRDADVSDGRADVQDYSRYWKLFHQIDAGFCIIEPVNVAAGEPVDFRYLEANAAFETQSGVSGVVGKTIREAFPDGTEDWLETYHQIILTGEAQHFERGLVIEERILEVSTHRIEDNGRYLLAIVFSDITKHKRVEHELRATEARLRDLNADLERTVQERARERSLSWKVSPDLLGALNAEGYFATSNPAWKTMLGWSECEVASMSIFEMLHPDDVERTRVGFQLTQEGKPAIQFPNRYRCKDGSYRWISWVGILEDGFVYCTGRDITEEREQADLLLKAEDALRQSQKMDAVGQLTGGLAHDFNNLLVSITGSLEILQIRIAQGQMQELDRYIVAAQKASKRAAALTHRLLAFSRRQTLDPKPTDINRLVAGMEELIRRTLGPAISIDPIVSAEGVWTTLVDPLQLETALLNLCINARDAMPDGGKLTVETANRWIDERSGKQMGIPAGQYVSLCVSDTGTGMSPEIVARVFDPFFTTKPIGQGTGLGLSMIYGFVHQTGGQVRIYSEVGQGTMVCLYLPRHLGKEEAEDDLVYDDKDQRALNNETILIVDDEPTIRMLIAEVLATLGYSSIEAGDGAAALKILQSERRIDLLITDVGLPGGMNGRQVADAARTLRHSLHVLFITGYAENAVLRHSHLEPGMHVMTKPFEMEALARRVKALLQTH